MTTVAQMIEWMKTMPQDAEVECGVAEGKEQQWTVTVGTKTGGTSHTMTFSGTKEQAIKKAVARFGTSKNPVVNAVPAKQGVAEGSVDHRELGRHHEEDRVKYPNMAGKTFVMIRG